MVSNTECQCKCSGDSTKYCGCNLRNRVWKLANVVSNTAQYLGKSGKRYTLTTTSLTTRIYQILPNFIKISKSYFF